MKFYLIFNESWPFLFDKINEFLKVEIKNLSSENYLYSTLIEENKNQILIEFDFKVVINNGTEIEMNINFNESLNDEFLLLNKQFSKIFKENYCPISAGYFLYHNFLLNLIKFFLLDSSSCFKIMQEVTPILKATKQANILELSFSKDYGSIFNNYSETTIVKIDTLKASLYNYTISRSKISGDSFLITLSFSTSISNHPILYLTLNPPSSIYQNSSTILKLTKLNLQIALPEFYLLDETTKELVSTTNEGTDKMNTVTGDAFAVNNFVMGSSFGIRSLVSMETIRFLRYFMIDYPPPVMAMYETSLPLSDMIPNILLFEDEEPELYLPEIFIKYDMSMYVFNNNGNILIETCCFLLIGVVANNLLKLRNKWKNKKLNIVFLIMRMVFVWNYSLSYFLSQFMGFTLATFLGYRFPTTSNATGYFNYFFAILNSLIIMAGFFFFFSMINQLRSNLRYKFAQEKEKKRKKNSEGFNNSTNRDLKFAENNDSNIQISPASSPIKINLENNEDPKKLSTEIEISTPSKIETIKHFQPSVFRRNQITPMENKIETVDLIEDRKKIKTPGSPTELINKQILQNSPAHLIEFNDSTVKTPEKVNNFFNLVNETMDEKDMNQKHKKNNQINEIPVIKSKRKIWTDFFEKFSNFFSVRKNGNNKMSFLSRFKAFMKKKFGINPKFDWRDYEDREKKIEILNRSFFPLHKDFKHAMIYQSFYILLDLFRQTLFCLLVVLLYDHPFSGLFIINIINIAFIVGFLIIRPFKQRSDLIQNFLNEFCLFISSMTAFIIAGMDKFGVKDLDTKMMLGWIMVGVNTFLIFVFLTRIVFNFIIIFVLLMKFILRKILMMLRKTSKIEPEKKDDSPMEKRKEEDQTILEQMIEIENFLR